MVETMAAIGIQYIESIEPLVWSFGLLFWASRPLLRVIVQNFARAGIFRYATASLIKSSHSFKLTSSESSYRMLDFKWFP